MKNDDANRPGEATDEELDRFLATGDDELLDHIQATIDPNRLTEIMDRPVPETPAPGTGRTPGQASASKVIQARALAAHLARNLDHARDLNRDLENALDFDITRACDVIRDITRDLDLDRDFDITRAFILTYVIDIDITRDLARDLDIAIARARDLDIAIAFGLAPDIARARALEDALEDARSSARRIVSTLNAQQVDASDADLSDMEIEHIEALDGVVWTRRTIWPPGIAGQVEEHSEEIGDGVYQVRLGQRDEARV